MNTLRSCRSRTFVSPKVDHHRCLRRGFAEVISTGRQTADQIAAIAQSMMKFGSNILITRVDTQKAQAVMALIGPMDYHPQARSLTLKQEAPAGLFRKERFM